MANLPKNLRVLSGVRVTVVHYQVGEKIFTYELNEELDKLPRDLNLRWGAKDWDKEEVSNWLSIKYDWVLNDLNIKQSGTYVNDTCGCC